MTLMERVAKLEQEVFGRSFEDDPLPLPLPHPMAADPPSYRYDVFGLLISPQPRILPGGVRVESRVGPDCPSTAMLPATAHVLCLPSPGETFYGYLMRVSYQAGFEDTHRVAGVVGGAMGIGSQGLWSGFSAERPVTWPETADRFFNPRSYMTPAEVAEDDRARAQWPQQ